MTTSRRPRPEPYKPPAEFGQRAIELAKALGKTPEELVRAVGYESAKTLARLAKGEGSLEFALAIRDQLANWGADVSALPSLGVERAAPLEPWEEQWLEVGRRLHLVATEKRFEEAILDVEDLIRSHLRVEGSSSGIPRRRG